MRGGIFMAKKKLRFEAGTPVIIELIEAKDPSCCRFGYKVGDSWEVNVWENSGLCGLAYNSFFPFITMFQTGGEAVWKRADPSKDKKDRVIRTCPDLRPGFRFLIRRKDEQERNK
jgi:uncharacterized repeat protein (TIGR04076 family)